MAPHRRLAVIDLRCHILPGLEGPLMGGLPTVDESIALARRAVTAGVSVVVATPWIDEHRELAPEDVRARVRELQRQLDDADVALQVVSGAEVAVDRLEEFDDDQIRLLTLGDGGHLAIKSPTEPVSILLERDLFDLQLRGFRPVLAHPERSPVFQDDPERLVRLVDAGVLCSITARAMTGHFGGKVRAFAIWLLQEGLVHNVASEAHHEQTWPPTVLASFNRLDLDFPGVLEQAAWYTEQAPAAILAGRELPPHPGPLPPRRAAGGILDHSRGERPRDDDERVLRDERWQGDDEPDGDDRPRADDEQPTLEFEAVPPVAVDSLPDVPASAPAAPKHDASAGARTFRQRPGVWAAAAVGVLLAGLGITRLADPPWRSEPERSAGQRPAVAVASGPGAARVAVVPVLAYHAVGDGGGPDEVTRRELAGHLDALGRAGFEAIDADRFDAVVRGSGPDLPPKPVLLAFDHDGLRDSAVDALLAERGMRAVLFASTGRVGGSGRLGWDALRALEATGRWDFGSQGRSATIEVPVDPRGRSGAFLEVRRWIAPRGRPELEGEYARRVERDLSGSVRDFTARGLAAPRLFSFPALTGDEIRRGQPVAPGLRRAIFERFSTALVDVAPPASVTAEARGSYAPRVNGAQARSGEDLVAILEEAGRQAPSAGARPTPEEERRVVESWSRAVRVGRASRAADLFAPGAVIEQSQELVLTSPEAALRFNRRLPCRGRVGAVRRQGDAPVAWIQLLPTPNGACMGTVRVRFVVRDGRFREWRQLPPSG